MLSRYEQDQSVLKPSDLRGQLFRGPVRCKHDWTTEIDIEYEAEGQVGVPGSGLVISDSSEHFTASSAADPDRNRKAASYEVA